MNIPPNHIMLCDKFEFWNVLVLFNYFTTISPENDLVLNFQLNKREYILYPRVLCVKCRGNYSPGSKEGDSNSR